MSQDFVKGSEAQPKPRPARNDAYSIWWDRHHRTKKLIDLETLVCPNAGPQEFIPDNMRYCMKRLHGNTCQGFRAKPFNKCPKFLE